MYRHHVVFFSKLFDVFSAGLGEFKIRDLNDEINKLLREKGHWEVRIKELGGPDYRVSSYSIYISDNVFFLFMYSVLVCAATSFYYNSV